MYSETTREIEVTVKPIYLEDQSEPADNRYVWAYQVRIENILGSLSSLRAEAWLDGISTPLPTSRGNSCQPGKGNSSVAIAAAPSPTTVESSVERAPKHSRKRCGVTPLSSWNVK